MTIQKIATTSAGLALSCLISINVFATGPGASGGGDSICFEFMSLTGLISSSMEILGQQKIDQVNPIVKIHEIVEIRKKLQCEPRYNIGAVAVSYPDKSLTHVSIERWPQTEIRSKLAIAVHELFILARYEDDGEYPLTEPILNFLIAESAAIRNKLSTNHELFNPDGTTTFLVPFADFNQDHFRIGNSEGDLQGAHSVCNFFGYKKALSCTYSSVHEYPKVANITQGQVSGVGSFKYVVESITCAN